MSDSITLVSPGQTELEDLAGESFSTGPVKLEIWEGRQNLDLSALHRVRQTEELTLYHCDLCSDWSAIGRISTLRHLSVVNCSGFCDLRGLEHATSLEEVSFQSCPALISARGLPAIACLRSVDFTNCPALSDASGIAALPCLKEVAWRGAHPRADLSFLLHLKDPELINLSGNPGIGRDSRLIHDLSLKFPGCNIVV